MSWKSEAESEPRKIIVSRELGNHKGECTLRNKQHLQRRKRGRKKSFSSRLHRSTFDNSDLRSEACKFSLSRAGKRSREKTSERTESPPFCRFASHRYRPSPVISFSSVAAHYTKWERSFKRHKGTREGVEVSLLCLSLFLSNERGHIWVSQKTAPLRRASGSTVVVHFVAPYISFLREGTPWEMIRQPQGSDLEFKYETRNLRINRWINHGVIRGEEGRNAGTRRIFYQEFALQFPARLRRYRGKKGDRISRLSGARCFRSENRTPANRKISPLILSI